MLDGPLGTLSSRRDAAYCLGLLSPSGFRDLQTIGEIRNRFAHSHLQLSFADTIVMELSGRLESHLELGCAGKSVEPDELPLLAKRNNARARFSMSVVVIAQDVLLSAHRTAHTALKSEARIIRSSA